MPEPTEASKSKKNDSIFSSKTKTMNKPVQNLFRYSSVKVLDFFFCFLEVIFFGQFGQSNKHCTLDFLTDQPGRNQIYQNLGVAAKILLSNLYTVICRGNLNCQNPQNHSDIL